MTLSLMLWAALLAPQSVADPMCLATTIYLEARDQPVQGQYAVAEVALRRLESKRFGSTVCAVVLQPGQFAPSVVSGKTQITNQTAWNRAWRIAVDSLRLAQLPQRMRPSVVPGADHFFAFNTVLPKWAVGTPVATIGDHTFYNLR